jgi:hypothetical protein
MLSKSPSGSVCPYYFMGGELHPLKYGGYKADKQKLFAIIKAEEEFILRSPENGNRRVWVDLYDTELDGEVIAELARYFAAIEQKIKKLCFVGCGFCARLRLKYRLKRESRKLAEQIRFFADPEDAKQWLVGEKY